jgi:hypothetical protein
MSVAEHTQSVVAVGIPMVQVPRLVAPTLTLKAEVPLLDVMEAPLVPHPLAATVGAVKVDDSTPVEDE